MRRIRALEARGESSILSILIQIKAENMSEEIRKHPLNVPGKYYIDQDICLVCFACVDEAPNNIADIIGDPFPYFFKQPETPEEDAQCKMAMMTCPVEAIRDDG